MRDWLPILVFLAGAGQIVLALASLAIPRILSWRQELAGLRPLTRQVFWTYAGYILVTNLCFGLLSAFIPRALLDRSPLAGAVTAFITLWWGARLAIQFVWFDRSGLPAGPWGRLAEFALVGLFAFLTATYSLALGVNLGAIG